MNIRPTNGRVEVRKTSFNPNMLDRFSILAFPNPATNYTRLQFNLEHDGPIQLCIFDLTGRKLIEVLNEENMPAGQYQYDVDLSVLSAGIYYSSILSVDRVATSKVVVLK